MHPYINRPIPDLSVLRSEKARYRTHPMARKEEPCVKVNTIFLCRSYYWHHDLRPPGAREEIFLRESVVDKLWEIERTLSSLGLRLLIKEGYRSLLVQKFVEEVSVLKGLRKEYPTLSDEQLKEKSLLFAAHTNGDLQASPPPHMTGGAVDLTLYSVEESREVDMGKSGGGLFSMAFPDSLELIDPKEVVEPRRCRRLLYWLAHEHAMVTNPTEWWHLCYGDQMWAWAINFSHAFYGIAKGVE